MRVSQRLDYALRMLVLLAMQPAGTQVAAGDLADRLGLPRRFVEQQISSLSRAGIVRSRRGAAGGCVLARPAETISVRDVVEASRARCSTFRSTRDRPLPRHGSDAALALAGALGAVDLRHLASRQRDLDCGVGFDVLHLTTRTRSRLLRLQRGGQWAAMPHQRISILSVVASKPVMLRSEGPAAGWLWGPRDPRRRTRRPHSVQVVLTGARGGMHEDA